MLRVLALLRSPRLALAVLSFLATYCGAAAWFPWSAAGGPPPPAWAARLHLDHPFSSSAFVAAVALLFLCTFACLWARTPATLALWRGDVATLGVPLPVRPGGRLDDLLRTEGFRQSRSGAYFRFRHALWAGWVLHLGLLAVIAGVVTQRACFDGGAFELAEGGTIRLSAPGAVFAREQGPLAPSSPPDLVLGLTSFDPFLHQPGYAPDRASRLRVEAPGQAAREGVLDRSQGLEVGDVTVYQAIPTGLTLNLDVDGIGPRSFHLHADSPLVASGSFDAPGGAPARFTLRCERRIDDPLGTGPLTVQVEQGGARMELTTGTPFPFGHTTAHLVSVGRWGGFTYARSPGMPAVQAGFALVLLGTALLTFPAGAARVADGNRPEAGWIYLSRGRDVLLAEWGRHGGSSVQAGKGGEG